MSIQSNPNSNPLGTFDTGTTGSNLGQVSNGGQNANVKQEGTIDGTAGVALHEKAQIGDTSTEVAQQDAPQSVPNPSQPELLPPGSFRMSSVKLAGLGEIGGNGGKGPGKGLGNSQANSEVSKWFSSFLTTMSVNSAEISKLTKEIHKAEGQFTARNLGMIWSMAQETANLIMSKAQTEANMHLALAISAMVGLGIAVAGAALSLGGAAKGAAAKMRKENLADRADTGPKPLEARAGGEPVAPLRPSSQAPNSPGINRLDRDSPIAGRDFSAVKPNKSKAPDGVGNKAPVDPKKEREKIMADKADAKAMAIVGQAVTQASGSIKDIIDNVIQMIMKMEIARDESAIELARARKELASKALDSSIQSFNGASEVLDAALRSLDKVVDSSIQANSINSRG